MASEKIASKAMASEKIASKAMASEKMPSRPRRPLLCGIAVIALLLLSLHCTLEGNQDADEGHDHDGEQSEKNDGEQSEKNDGEQSEKNDGEQSEGDADRADSCAVRPILEINSDSGQIATCLAAPCALGELPLLGQLAERPTIEQIASRVVVSHRWMYDRFIELFEELPLELQEDLRLLFRPVAAIRIANNIRPSYYTSSTASIHLDPANLWLTKEEKLDICTEADYRSGYGSELPFLHLSRRVIGDEYASQGYSLEDDSERALEEIIVGISRLLFHELAHANDYIPPHILQDVDLGKTPGQFVSANSSHRISTLLADDEELSLKSEEMREYALIRYRGRTVDDFPRFRDYTAEDMGGYFEPDGATHTYSYSTIREDLAMLFEMAFAKFHFNVDWDIAFIERPEQPMWCDDYIVTWGSRGRVGDPHIQQRAQFVTDRVLPERDLSRFFADLSPAQQMSAGCGWCDSLDLACPDGDWDRFGRSFPEESREIPLPPEDINPPFGLMLR